MNGPDPLEGFEADLDHHRVASEVVEVPLPEAAPLEEREARYVLYLGLLDLLVDALEARCATPGEAASRLGRALRQLESVQPVLRFDLFEASRAAEAQDLVARVRDKEVAMATRWLVPRLEALVAAGTRRLAALRAALGEGGGR